MADKHWHRAEQILNAALDLPVQERERYVESSCASDPDLDAEVRSLLHAYGLAETFLERPALHVAAESLARREKPTLPAQPTSPPLAGRTLSHYRILEKLGDGGMGVVYRAEDTRLHRQVALKLLPDELSDSSEMLARFRQEAQAASALNHPNICTVYDVGEQEGRVFMVMEYLQGSTLKHLIAGRPLPVDRLLDLGVQMCDGLGAAHQHGIVHRDIKPTNIFVCEDNRVKILDFGIAKMLNIEAQDHPSDMPEPWLPETRWLTQSGSTVGTLDYMSPEQIRGESLDARSDLFSLGAVLFEMAVGQPAFRGRSRAEILDTILRNKPGSIENFIVLQRQGLEQIVSRCLQKDRVARYQHVAEVRADLLRVQRKTDWLKRTRRARGWSVLTASAASLVIGGYLLTRPLPPPRVTNYVQLTNDGLGKGPDEGALVTDGKKLYFGAGSGMSAVIEQVATSGGETSVLPTAPPGEPGIEDISPNHNELLASNYMGFSQSFGWPLWLLPLGGSEARQIGTIAMSCATWSPDGREIAYVTGHDVYRAQRDGSQPRKLATLPGTAFWLRWSPDGKRLRMTIGNPLARFGILKLWEVQSDGSGSHAFLSDWNQPPTACCGNWTPDGKYYLFQATRENKTEVWAMREQTAILDLLRNVSQPVQLTSGQMDSMTPLPSLDGKKLFVVGQKLRGELMRYHSRSGQWVPYLAGLSGEFASFSRDGQWVAYSSFPDGSLWRSRIDGSQRLQLTFAPMQAQTPSWSPDGKQIAFAGARPGEPWHVRLISALGGGSESIAPEPHNQGRPSWSADGGSIAFSYLPGPETENGIQIVNLAERKRRKLPGSDWLLIAMWSPDGRSLIARHSDHHVIRLFDFATQRWTDLVRRELNWLNWSRDGRYVYFEQHGDAHAVMRVGLKTRRVETVVSLENLKRTGANGSFWFGMAPDDSPLILRDTGSQEIYALNWEGQ